MKGNASIPSSDIYPDSITIEIDRTALRKFMRAGSIVLWLLPLSCFGLLFGMSSGMHQLDDRSLTLAQMLVIVLSGLGKGLGISLAIGLVGYFLFNHVRSRRYAETLEVSVEGSYLRICHGGSSTSDRKIHFRSIVDYDARQSWLMSRFGIQSLLMNTNGGGPGSVITIPGIKDCLKVRDMLSEIDSLREYR